MNYPYLCLLALLLVSCQPGESPATEKGPGPLAEQVKAETQRSWAAYKQYAWGSDVLLPISKKAENWYEEPLYISPIDAYSTLKVMGLDEEAAEIERYLIDSISFDKDIFVKVFEVNIRVLGGLLAMYQYTENEQVLQKAVDFGNRLLPAFNSPTGVPYYWVNLKTGAVKGQEVNVAEAGTYLLELGILSHFSGNPVYYQKAKDADKALFERRSKLGLIGEVIDVETGEWKNTSSHICAGIDSYYEYLYKAWVLFQDPELKVMWDESIAAVHAHIPETKDSLLWYGRVDMHTGARLSSVVTLYDAFFPHCWRYRATWSGPRRYRKPGTGSGTNTAWSPWPTTIRSTNPPTRCTTSIRRLSNRPIICTISPKTRSTRRWGRSISRTS
ncbi:MAG: glycoside hydrolase family 47 protein [Saprospirales bacterium]|nr:glycoside hydrolase family 47 protein [Saprospirales bacterium]